MIAGKTDIAVATVKVHVKAVLRKKGQQPDAGCDLGGQQRCFPNGRPVSAELRSAKSSAGVTMGGLDKAAEMFSSG